MKYKPFDLDKSLIGMDFGKPGSDHTAALIYTPPQGGIIAVHQDAAFKTEIADLIASKIADEATSPMGNLKAAITNIAGSTTLTHEKMKAFMAVAKFAGYDPKIEMDFDNGPEGAKIKLKYFLPDLFIVKPSNIMNLAMCDVGYSPPKEDPKAVLMGALKVLSNRLQNVPMEKPVFHAPCIITGYAKGDAVNVMDLRWSEVQFLHKYFLECHEKGELPKLVEFHLDKMPDEEPKVKGHVNSSHVLYKKESTYGTEPTPAAYKVLNEHDDYKPSLENFSDVNFVFMLKPGKKVIHNGEVLSESAMVKGHTAEILFKQYGFGWFNEHFFVSQAEMKKHVVTNYGVQAEAAHKWQDEYLAEVGGLAKHEFHISYSVAKTPYEAYLAATAEAAKSGFNIVDFQTDKDIKSHTWIIHSKMEHASLGYSVTGKLSAAQKSLCEKTLQKLYIYGAKGASPGEYGFIEGGRTDDWRFALMNHGLRTEYMSVNLFWSPPLLRVHAYARIEIQNQKPDLVGADFEVNMVGEDALDLVVYHFNDLVLERIRKHNADYLIHKLLGITIGYGDQDQGGEGEAKGPPFKGFNWDEF